MTPCYVTDGEMALTENPATCVGCWLTPEAIQAEDNPTAGDDS